MAVWTFCCRVGLVAGVEMVALLASLTAIPITCVNGCITAHRPGNRPAPVLPEGFAGLCHTLRATLPSVALGTGIE